jgi:UV DNA damage endonuclease
MIRLGYAYENKYLLRYENIQLDTIPNKDNIIANGIKNGEHLLKQCALNNLANLISLLIWNNKNKIHIFVLPNNIFPYVSDDYFNYDIKFAKSELMLISNMIKKFRQRILFILDTKMCHLGSILDHIRVYSTRSITTYAKILSYFPSNCVVIMTIDGEEPEINDALYFGTTKDMKNIVSKEQSLQRWISHFLLFDNSIKQRIVLQNDPYRYTAQDLLPICEKMNIPLCLHTLFDNIHGQCANKPEILSAIRTTWERRNMHPIILHSETAGNTNIEKSIKEKLVNSPLINDFPELWDTMDVIFLSVAKEQSVFNVYQKYGFNVETKHLLNLVNNPDKPSFFKQSAKNGLNVLNELP